MAKKVRDFNRGACQKSKVTIEDLWSINFAYTVGRNGW